MYCYEIFYLIIILKVTKSVYAHDSAVIVDAGETLTQNRNAMMKILPPFPLWHHYPRYRIIPPPPAAAAAIWAMNTWHKTAPISTSTTSTTRITSTSTTKTPNTALTSTTTSLPISTYDEFPAELLDISQNMLGLNSIADVPSISELAKFLGTNNPEETLKFVKQLSLFKQGVKLLKAYIESRDYIDTTERFYKKNYNFENDEEEGADDIEKSSNVNDESLTVITDEDLKEDYELNNENKQTNGNTPELKNTTKTTQKLDKLPFLNNLLNQPEDKENVQYSNIITKEDDNVPSKEISQSVQIEESSTESQIKNIPIFVRESIPHKYPVANRIQTSTTPSTPSEMVYESLTVISDEDLKEDYELSNENKQTNGNTPELNKTTKTTQKLDKLPLNNLLNQPEDKENVQYSNIITKEDDNVPSKEISQSVQIEESSTESQIKNIPIFVRESIPHKYPVPNRIQTSTTPSTPSEMVYLNTPKILMPYLQQLSRLTKIPPKEIENFLSNKPKLLELAIKGSRMQIGYDHNSPIEAQVIAAMQKEFAKDEDLKRLLSSAATLN